MGYSIFQIQAGFFIGKEHHSSALKQIKLLNPKKVYPNSDKPHFAFVETSCYQDANTLAEALQAWRWLADFDDEDNIIGIEFLGEKLGDEEILFQVIAPYILDGSSIQLAGEDGRIWRWLFCDRIVKKQEGEVMFRSSPE